MSYLAHFAETSGRFVDHLTHFDLSIGALTYATVPVGAYLAFRQQRAREDLGHGLMAFLRFCLPREGLALLRHPTIRLDIGFVALKHLFNVWVLVPLLLSSALAANFVYAALTHELGARAQHSPGLALTIGMMLVCVLVQDFVQFLVHYTHHKVKLLWAVHMVHHSAEFLLMSLSVKRTHFIEDAINLTMTSAFLGMLIGVMSYGFSLRIWESEVYGVDTLFLLQLFSFWHLRHSHVSLSYGWLEYILQSPAQHQLHHSVEREHWDKNFGLLFSFWDLMFGCFLRSADPHSFRLGVPEVHRRDYDSVLKLYVTPLRRIGQALVGLLGSGQRRSGARLDAAGIPDDAAALAHGANANPLPRLDIRVAETAAAMGLYESAEAG